MNSIKLFAIIMGELKKVYGEDFENLTDYEKQHFIWQYMQEIMARDPFLKACISEMFYNEFVGE